MAQQGFKSDMAKFQKPCGQGINLLWQGNIRMQTWQGCTASNNLEPWFPVFRPRLHHLLNDVCTGLILNLYFPSFSHLLHGPSGRHQTPSLMSFSTCQQTPPFFPAKFCGLKWLVLFLYPSLFCDRLLLSVCHTIAAATWVTENYCVQLYPGVCVPCVLYPLPPYALYPL